MCLFAPAGCKGSHQSAAAATFTTTQLHSDSIISRSLQLLVLEFFADLPSSYPQPPRLLAGSGACLRSRSHGRRWPWARIGSGCAERPHLRGGSVCEVTECLRQAVGRTNEKLEGVWLVNVRSPPARGGPNVRRVEGFGAAGETK